MVGLVNKQRLIELLVEAIERGDWTSCQDFVSELEFLGGTGDSEGGQEDVRIEGQPIGEPSWSEAIGHPEGVRPIPRQESPIKDRTVSMAAGSVDLAGLNVGQLVDLTRSRTGSRASVMDPAGVVRGKAGPWSDLAIAGPVLVRLDGAQWLGDSGDLWVSPAYAGVATSKMPTSARDGIVRIGRRIGPVRNGLVEALVHPPVAPATWFRVWEYDADNYIDLEHIALRGGWWRKVFRVAGTTVGILTESNLSIAGQLVELPYTADSEHPIDKSRNGEIEWASASTMDATVPAISFGCVRVSDSKYIQSAELDGNGDLRVGELLEGTMPQSAGSSVDFGGLPYQWNSTTNALALTLDKVTEWMRFVRTSGSSPINARLEVKEIKEDAV